MMLFAAALVLTGGTIIGPRSDVPNAVVIIRGGRIEAAGPGLKIPKDAHVIRVDGAYIVPGLTDVFAGLNSQSQANAYLYMGVTSIVGSDEPGGRRGALLMTAHPSPTIYRLAVVNKLSDVDAAVKAKAGAAKVLLIYYETPPDQMLSIVRRARALGMGTIGELGRTKYTDAIDAGVDAFVHASRYALELAPKKMREAVARNPFGPPRTAFYKYLASLDPNSTLVAAWAKRIASTRVSLIPTLSLYYGDLPNHENPWREPIAAILDEKDIHLPLNRQTGASKPAPGVPRGLSANVLRIEERYCRAGAHYLAGSGTSAFGTMPGISLHNELRMLVELGLTPRQAIAAATANVGEAFNWQVGKVAKGFKGDLVVLDADPTRDIANLKKIRMVIHDGEIVDRAAILK